jgi:hypothetical protein
MPETGPTAIADLKMRIMRAEKFARRSGDRSEVDDLRRRQCTGAADSRGHADCNELITIVPWCGWDRWG